MTSKGGNKHLDSKTCFAKMYDYCCYHSYSYYYTFDKGLAFWHISTVAVTAAILGTRTRTCTRSGTRTIIIMTSMTIAHLEAHNLQGTSRRFR